MKIVVFDLDETLGYFTEFGILWNSVCMHTTNKEKGQAEFNDLLDLYPEFLRPNMMTILNYLKQKKQENQCHRIFIYTNNNGPPQWAMQLVSYFEHKMGNVGIIDQIIHSFVKSPDSLRTTQCKTHDDLLRCTRLNKQSTSICFIDDTYHPGMDNEYIYYINIKPYFHSLAWKEIFDRFRNSSVRLRLIQTQSVWTAIQRSVVLHPFQPNLYVKTDDELELDVIIGKHLICLLNEFFQEGKGREREKEGREKKRTLKHLPVTMSSFFTIRRKKNKKEKHLL
jgi:hypothetical protein